MALIVFCKMCGNELDEPGAILLPPPDADDWLQKQHVCVECFGREKDIRCHECSSDKYCWYASVRVNQEIQEGQLRSHDVTPTVYLACEECSGTIMSMDLDQFLAERVNKWT